MINKTLAIFECSRVFSLPTSLLSWLVIFVFAIINSGNIPLGIIALIGIVLAHLGTNLIDDYFDYKSLIKQVNFDKAEYLKNSQKTKCRYLVNGVIKPEEILIGAAVYFGIALILGIFLYFKCGIGVLYYTLAGGVVALIYPFISRICLSELAVALAYGPILFGGVYYVMTGTNSKEAFLLSIPTMLMTVVLLYIHTVMDYDYDVNEGKKTISNSFDSQLDSLIVLKILLTSAYLATILMCILDILDWQAMLVLLTIPLAADLYKSMCEFACNPERTPIRKWYHFPMENFEIFEKNGEASFIMRIFQARNLMIYFSILYIIGIIFSTAL